MSIIYNDQVVAGKYTQQVVADADTVNSGIIKIATQEEVNEGVDNTTAVTPFYLAQKQNKIEAGDGIVIDSNNVISCTANPDEETIKRKGDGTMQCVGQLTKSNTLKFDWEGTQAEYTDAMLNGEIQPDWYCYITDDESIVDYADVCNQSLSNLRPEGEARFEAKADKATTLEGYGITDGLNKNQITNCLLEVPQNIKLELQDGVLTLKAGSQVIVPNGFEADGVTPKFDYVLVENDTKYVATTASIAHHLYSTSEKNIKRRRTDRCYSGNAEPTSIKEDDMWYDTANNIIKRRVGSSWDSTLGLSLPFCIATDDGTSYTIDQVFNGFGYIGSTVWVDKGVKGLIPDGRNEDGTLKNIEITTDSVKTVTFNIGRTNTWFCILSNKTVNLLTNAFYDEKDNYIRPSGSGNNAIRPYLPFATGSTDSTGRITEFNPKPIFRAVDYNEFNQTVNKIEDNLSTKLNESQITNCLLEIPQRIKYTLESGTLTIKAGSVAIVPYGVEDLTNQYPNGTTFIHENFKVVDAQFADGKFFVWVEVQSDIVSYQTATDTKMRPALIDLSRNLISTLMNTTSSNVTFDGTGNNNNYRTDLNIIENTLSGVHNSYVMSLPLMTVMSDAVVIVKTVEQVFNGMGYIGSTKWLDKGVKLLCCDGRNEDGTLKNVEVTTKTVRTYAGGTAKTEYFDFFDLSTGGVSRIAQRQYTLIANSLGELDAYASNYAVAYIVPENKLYWHSTNGTWTPFVGACVGSHVHSDAQGTVSEIKPKQPFRAVDYNDFVTTPRIVETYVNGTSWYRIWSDGWIEQGGQIDCAKNTSVTVTFLKAYTNTNYNVTGMSHFFNADKYDVGPTLTNRTTTTMNLGNMWNSTVTFQWRTAGY